MKTKELLDFLNSAKNSVDSKTWEKIEKLDVHQAMQLVGMTKIGVQMESLIPGSVDLALGFAKLINA